MSSAGTSHVERTAQEPRDEKLHSVLLSRIDQVNAHVRLFRLTLQSGPANFKAGQWLDTYVPGVPKAGGFTITSPPSAASSCANTPYLELAVQESPSNPPAAWLWRPAEKILGQTLQVRVGGSFVFPPLGWTRMPETVVFVAGGVGINPLMSMLSYIAEMDGDVAVKVLYGSRVREGGIRDVLFADRIAELFASGKLRGQLQLFYTAAGEEHVDLKQDEESLGMFDKAGVMGKSGRMTLGDVEAALGNVDRGSSVVYVCGPPQMTDEMVGFLTSPVGAGLAERQVMMEKWW